MKAIRWKFVGTLAGILAAAGAATAGDAPLASSAASSPIPLEAFASPPKYREAALSPDGRTLAVLTPINGRENLAVIDLETRKATALTGFDSRDVVSVIWVNSQRLGYITGELDATAVDNRRQDLVFVDKDGKEQTQWAVARATTGSGINAGSHGYSEAVLFAGLEPMEGQSTDEVHVFGAHHNHLNAFTYDTRTATLNLLSLGIPEGAYGWVFDHAGVLRIARTWVKGATAIWYRASASADWQKIGDFPLGKPVAFDPLGFDFDDKTLFVAAGQADGWNCVCKFDLATGTVSGESIFRVKGFSLADAKLVFDLRNKQLAGIRYAADRRTTHWVSPAWAAFQKSIDEALPAHENQIIGNVGDERLVIFSWSDVDPGTYYLFETKKRAVTELLSPRPDIDPDKMSPMKFVRYSARDGLSIPAFVTIPKNSAGKHLPLIVDVHGGPYVRTDFWGYNPEVQFLASRGYAVIQPQFRGTPGFGFELYRKGWRQWGLTMQDDLNDAVQWAVDQGIADPKRVCLYGASYGGYAVMEGLARDPGMYRCGVDLAGVTDINLLYDVTWSDTAYSDATEYSDPVLIGDPEKDAAQLKATSPLLNAARIKDPVLMVYGGDDVRVPIVHGIKMRDAIAANSGRAEWVVYNGEGHGLHSPANQADFFRRLETFLAENLK